MTDWKSMYPQFVDAILERLTRGAEEYGEASFTRPELDIALELEQELLDVAGWAFIRWVRLQQRRGAR